MKKILLSLLILCGLWCSLPLAGYVQQGEDANQPPWHLLEQGKIAFEQKNFGQALILISRARNLHNTQAAKQYEYLFSALKSYEVRAAGDKIANVYNTLKKREDHEACAILDTIFLTHPPVFFEKSITKLMDWLKKRQVYPECDYLIGKIYEIEGEYQQAFKLYQSAWEAREFLYIPDMRFEIIYALAHITALMNNVNEQEQYLLLILTEDPLYGTTNAESATFKSMLHIIKNEETVEKFFSLYRHHNDIALRAYTELTAIYTEAGEFDRAFRTALLAADIAVTYLSGAIKNIDFTYTYTNFSDLLTQVGANNDILQLAQSQNIWRIFLQFADLLQQQGFVLQASDLYEKLAKNCPAPNYAQEAAYKHSKILN